ncbi:PAS domain-containing sensor histidine kinase [Spirosoma pollinicola]|uniref:histidine kinase n=1 Tax=Spirosoma pollinicola TaxID=2057025 RepID=A0A2K8YV97_9BACT|nr:PAS domain-containing sensor histidine kinase [Spirosoma pollinicola]AUD01560.1 PAS domain-containing sensor histidine kinase [Spirosoma pollinicola]
MTGDSFEAVFTHATIAIIVSDERGKIKSANQYAHTLFGYKEPEMTNINIDTLVPKDVSHRHEHLRSTFAANPQVRAMGHGRDLYAKRKDETVFPAEISLSYFRQAGDLFVVAYILDITFKKDAERALLEQKSRIEQLNAELEQKVVNRTRALMATLHQLEQSKDELAKALATERELGELKSRFVAMASHEFRTPLSAVMTSASLIEKYPESDQQDKRLRHIQRIKSSVNHLNDILEEFLSVGKLEEGRIDARWSLVDLPSLVQEATSDLQGILKMGQRIETNFDCIKPVLSDPSLLRKILVNILSNSIKYSAENQTIQLEVCCRESTMTILVKDNGIGISADDQKHLFERFFRAKNATNFEGTGLGLHIVAKYIEILKGRIDLTSQLGEGTTIIILLPYENHSIN